VALWLVAFIAGLLTVLAPCVLPLLPVIIGGSLSAGGRWRPYLIVGSLAASLFIFTLALKVGTGLLGVPALAWSALSGGIIMVLGVFTVWPRLYDWVSAKTGFLGRSQATLARTGQLKGWLGPVLIGAALGPVFASCSPTYGLIIATILPVQFTIGLGYLALYLLGLSLFLLAIALAGRRLTSRLSWAANPHGWFKRILGGIFILVGLAIVTGLDKTAENFLIDHQLLNATVLEQYLLPSRSSGAKSDSTSATKTTGGPTVQLAVTNPQPAPELTGLTNWVNSPPLDLASLKGKVVLIDFWTYSCINCIHTLPHVQGWYEKYQAAGLVVVGVHAPEFSFEHIPANVAQAVKDDHLTYPVAQDNDLATWRAYQNQYWPAEYFIDHSCRRTAARSAAALRRPSPRPLTPANHLKPIWASTVPAAIKTPAGCTAAPPTIPKSTNSLEIPGRWVAPGVSLVKRQPPLKTPVCVSSSPPVRSTWSWAQLNPRGCGYL
jgi:cytochrome c biogenesis protein CcdA/thiol-disulfide isomerase/thioredoxin